MLWWADIEATIWELRATGLRNYLQLEVPYRELRAKTITGYCVRSVHPRYISWRVPGYLLQQQQIYEQQF